MPSSHSSPHETPKRLPETEVAASSHVPEADAPPRPPEHRTIEHVVPVRPRGRMSSPLRHYKVESVEDRPTTYVPSVLPLDLLYAPNVTNSRILLDLRFKSPVFMGGATVEGDIHLVIDGGMYKRREKSNIEINRIYVVVTGIESCKGKQEMFRVLMSDVVNRVREPPMTMAPRVTSEGTWAVLRSSSILPFCIDLPVKMGPPPYESKKAGIRYLASVNLEIKIDGKRRIVRQSREICVLSVLDPGDALLSLPDPLRVTDELLFSRRAGILRIILSAGIHRQTWISGYPVFVDIFLDNQSGRTIRTVELQVERVTTYNALTAPVTNQGTSLDSLRVPDDVRRELVRRKVVSTGLKAILPLRRESRTHQMDLPSGLVSIPAGRFFEVRYFLNVEIDCFFGKRLKVQLPITIVHPNSIDIPTNSLAQVAASVRHKSHRSSSTADQVSSNPYHPRQSFGPTFRHPFAQSRHELPVDAEEILNDVTRELEASPRKHRLQSDQQKLNGPKRKQSEPSNLRKQSSGHKSSGSGLTLLGNLSDPNISVLPRPTSSRKISNVHQQSTSRSGEAKSPAPFTFPMPFLTEFGMETSPSSTVEVTRNPAVSVSPTRAPRVSFHDSDTSQAKARTNQYIFSPPTSYAPAAVAAAGPLTEPRSSLEAKVHRGLRNLSIDNPDLQQTFQEKNAAHSDRPGLAVAEKLLPTFSRLMKQSNYRNFNNRNDTLNSADGPRPQHSKQHLPMDRAGEEAHKPNKSITRPGWIKGPTAAPKSYRSAGGDFALPQNTTNRPGSSSSSASDSSASSSSLPSPSAIRGLSASPSPAPKLRSESGTGQAFGKRGMGIVVMGGKGKGKENIA